MQTYIFLELNDSVSLDISVLNILLKDRTSNQNIIWATDDYSKFNNSFTAKNKIESYLFTKINTSILIRPRIAKTKDKQNGRTREKAEVFTPSWLCNEQNNLIDERWFGRKNVFNKQTDKAWKSIKSKIIFPDLKNRTWKDYVDARRMEITCGEAPYLVSRYDTVYGNIINLHRRIGLLDRKLRVVNENTINKKEWFEWVMRAYQSIYGYEYQGDNLLIARANLLYTFIDNMKFKFKQTPNNAELCKIATIISWNIWQMDGITNTIPFSGKKNLTQQLSIFEEDKKEHILCRIKDWRSKKIIEFAYLLEGKNNG